MIIPKDYTELLGYKYSKEVVTGEIVANKWVKLECQKYIDRLENKQFKDDFEFYMNMKEMKIIYGLLHLLNYSSGFYTGKPIINHIHGMQIMVIENIFGWFNKNDEESQRMIEEVILQIGRKSGKSFLSALIEIIVLLRAPMFAQTAIAGKTREISSLIKTEMENIIKSSPKVKKMFKCTREKILSKHNEATCHALSGEAQNLLGKLLTTYIVDEVANQLTSEIVDALKLSQMSVNSSRLAVYISTSFDNEKNTFLDMVDYYKKILDGELQDSGTKFGLIYELDAEDNYTEEAMWEKASPLQMSFENGRKFLRNQFAEALEIPSKMRSFRVFILNQYLPSSKTESFIPVSEVKKCVISKNSFSFKGKKCVLGIDLSLVDDNTAITISCIDNGIIYVKSIVYIPEERIIEKEVREKTPYRQHIVDGDCITIRGSKMNYKILAEHILQIEKNLGCKVIGVGFDKWRADYLVSELDSKYKMIEVPMNSKVLAPIYDFMEQKIMAQEICFLENDLLMENFSNCKVTYDTNMSRYITKKASKKKIDMVISCAISLVLLSEHINKSARRFVSYSL